MIRLDFGDGVRRARALRLAPQSGPDVQIVAQLSPHLPFKDSSIDEIFVDRALAHAEDVPGTMEEIWRISRPGTVIHLRLPHASSTWAVSRDPRHSRQFTLETFNYFDPERNNRTCVSSASFRVEHARLYLTGPRPNGRGLALARGAFARVIEGFVNQNRGMQYRWERWFAPLVGGFEEFSIVLSAVKETSLG